MTATTFSHSPTVDLTRELVQRDSVTPNDKGCQEIMIQRLENIGFEIERLRFGEVDNLWARRGEQAPVFAFAGHTDVVPTGPLEKWSVSPFGAKIKDGFLYGRGAADMKGGLAAMVTATERFVNTHPHHSGTIAFLITSDEEGAAVDGTKRVIDQLQEREEHIDWCVVGEPTSVGRLGDTIKVGRRGSLSGELTIHGKEGHIAYPHLADNPIHKSAQLIETLHRREWDNGNENFPPTSFQISNINGGTGAYNVIPSHLDISFNIRFSPMVTPEELRTTIHEICDDHGLEYEIKWKLFGQPFQTSEGVLRDGVVKVIEDVTGIKPELSTSGGTSDGRFIAPTGTEVVEFGVINATIHKADERVAIANLDKLSQIYEGFLRELLT